MLVIGSKAIKHWFPDFGREPKDVDIISKERGSTTWISKGPDMRVEFLDDPGITKYQATGYLRPDLLVTLKASHIFWDINWEKHMWDIQFLLGKGAKIQRDVFFELYDFWNSYHKKNFRSDLDMSAEDFFGNNVLELEIPHDTVHTFLKEEPTYKKVLADGAEVNTDEDKFLSLSHEDKMSLVREEVQVMSWERYKGVKWYIGYSKMLRKFLRMHAPIWQTFFIIENWKELVKCPVDHYKLINEKAEQWKKEFVKC